MNKEERHKETLRTWRNFLRGLNRIIRFNLQWDFKNPEWKLKKEV